MSSFSFPFIISYLHKKENYNVDYWIGKYSQEVVVIKRVEVSRDTSEYQALTYEILNISSVAGSAKAQ